jgi:TolB-like protein/DNA-binding winged helix-turn-helix (wHTH) protein/Tfp pilus assembly protein PilF
MNAPPPVIYQFGDFRLDPEKRLLSRDGSLVPLTPRVFDTLLYLVSHHGEMLEKERLMDAIWPDSIVEENNLTQNISALRRVLGETPGTHRFIVTVPGRGYRFVATVEHGTAGAVPPDRESPEAHPIVEVESSTLAGPPLSPKRSRPTVILLTTAGFVAAVIAALYLWQTRPPAGTAKSSTLAIVLPEKSIAVLPFANLSDDKENAFFTEGVQEDILTALGKVTDLKVISRTSVVSYVAGPARNIVQIAQELGVGNILEGSVRRAGGKVRVTAQLIETRTRTHLWAETYDRELTDVFAIQSDIAQQIAAALKAKLAPEEKMRLDLSPTKNADAYVLYLTALGSADFKEAENLFMRAITLDPGFALAYARASIRLSRDAKEDPALKARARAYAQEAIRLSPSLGEAHMAVGLSLYWGEKKYEAALKEFEIAATTLPNNAEIPGYVGGIYRRQGRWRDAVASFARAQSLDPRNPATALLAGNHHLFMRDWDTAAAGYKRSLELGEDSLFPQLGLAYLEVARNTDPGAAKRILEKLPSPSGPDLEMNLVLWDLAMLERDYEAAEQLLVDSRPGWVSVVMDTPKAFYQGRTALIRGDIESARRHFEAAAIVYEKRVRDDPDAASHHAYLGLVYAYRQMKDEAIRESRRALELEPESQNAYQGTFWVANLAMVYALVGESDRAIPLIEHLIAIPGPIQGLDYTTNITLGELRLRWEWDSLRSDPRFQKILAGPEPKTIY